MRPLSQDHYYYTIPLIDINGQPNRPDEPQRGPVINQKIYYTKFHEVASFYFGYLNKITFKLSQVVVHVFIFSFLVLFCIFVWMEKMGEGWR